MEIRKIIKLNTHKKNQQPQKSNRNNSFRKSNHEIIASIHLITVIMYIDINSEEKNKTVMISEESKQERGKYEEEMKELREKIKNF